MVILVRLHVSTDCIFISVLTVFPEFEYNLVCALVIKTEINLRHKYSLLFIETDVSRPATPKWDILGHQDPVESLRAIRNISYLSQNLEAVPVLFALSSR